MRSSASGASQVFASSLIRKRAERQKLWDEKFWTRYIPGSDAWTEIKVLDAEIAGFERIVGNVAQADELGRTKLGGLELAKLEVDRQIARRRCDACDVPCLASQSNRGPRASHCSRDTGWNPAGSARDQGIPVFRPGAVGDEPPGDATAAFCDRAGRRARNRRRQSVGGVDSDRPAGKPGTAHPAGSLAKHLVAGEKRHEVAAQLEYSVCEPALGNVSVDARQPGRCRAGGPVVDQGSAERAWHHRRGGRALHSSCGRARWPE